MKKATLGMPEPLVFQLRHDYGNNPFLILISCLLSLRAKDTATYPVSTELFKQAQTPQELLKIPLSQLEKIIYSIGFYKKKAIILQEVCQELLDRFDGKVPHTAEELLSIKGIGQKTANLVLGEGFGIPAICVDTHVHRLSNHFGLVSTKTADQTEEALKKIIPKKYWIDFNRLLVKWGQNVCKPNMKSCPCKELGLLRRDFSK